MDIQRLRNITTGMLHTCIKDIYEDLEYLSGYSGLMTHHLPVVCDKILPELKKQIVDPRFWDGKYDTTHTGEIDVHPVKLSGHE